MISNVFIVFAGLCVVSTFALPLQDGDKVSELATSESSIVTPAPSNSFEGTSEQNDLGGTSSNPVAGDESNSKEEDDTNESDNDHDHDHNHDSMPDDDSDESHSVSDEQDELPVPPGQSSQPPQDTNTSNSPPAENPNRAVGPSNNPFMPIPQIRRDPRSNALIKDYRFFFG